MWKDSSKEIRPSHTTLLRALAICGIALTSFANGALAQPDSGSRRGGRGAGGGQPVTAQDTARIRARLDSFPQPPNEKHMHMRDSSFVAVASYFGQMLLDIPEYHDQQRFVTGPASYGPMAYSYASPYLGGFETLDQLHAHGTVGLLVGVVYVDDPSSGAVALPAQYGALRLTAGLNCVYLAHAGPNKTVGWSATIVAGIGDKQCSRPEGAALPGAPPLTVEASPSGAQPRDYPAVMRFEEAVAVAGGRDLTAIGVRCLDRWCTILPGGAALRPSLPASFTNAARGIRSRVTGWHDEQMLSLFNGATLVPSGIRAKVIPEPGIETRSQAFYTGVWRRTATILLDGNPAGTKYSTKWGLHAGYNAVDMAYITGIGWTSRVGPVANPNMEVGASFTYLRVTQTPHLDLLVPGTARFRWLRNDESVWVSCDQGCCEVDAFK